MGTFSGKVEFEANGTHGCQRDIKDGQEVKVPCGEANCPDCLARQFINALKAQGHTMISANFFHWPGQPAEVRDDLLTGIRHGSFY